MKSTLKTAALLVALAVPTCLASNVFAAVNKSCGSCVYGAQPASHAGYGVTVNTPCSTCHNIPAKPASPAKPDKPTVPAIPATPAEVSSIHIYPTMHSCGTCVVGTAPSSVSAHKNVNFKMIVCAVCHTSNLATGTSSTGDKRNTADNHDMDEDVGDHIGKHLSRDNPPGSPGNSGFGHSHKQDKKPHRGHDE